jgi:hypothetical protein
MLAGQNKFKIYQYFKRKDTPECNICMESERSTASIASLIVVDSEGNRLTHKASNCSMWYVCAMHLHALESIGEIVI